MNVKARLVIFLVVVLVSAAVFVPPTIAQGSTPSHDSERNASGASPTGGIAYMTYQGRLTNASGIPINSAVQMIFKLYDDSGAVVWTSTTRTVTPTNGLFTVYLGASSDPSLFSDILVTIASVGVTVGGDAEMTPRQPFNTVIGHSVSGSGVVGTSNSSRGVYGYSNMGPGVEGESLSSPGVRGISNTGMRVYGYSSTGSGVVAGSNGSTKNNAAIRATNTLTTGLAGYFANNSTSANSQFYNAGLGQVLYLQNSYTGVGANDGSGGGPFIQATNQSENAILFKVDHVGNVSQVRDANGLVKAAVYANCANYGASIARSFNNVGGTITILSGGVGPGLCQIDFGFPVNDRYMVATASTWGISVSYETTGGNDLLTFYRFDSSGNGSNGYINVLVY